MIGTSPNQWSKRGLRAPFPCLKAACVSIWILLLGLLLSLPGTAGAARPYTFELTPTLGYRVGGTFEDSDTGESVDLENNSAFGLIFNIAEKPNTQYEFSWSHQDTSVDLSDSGGNPINIDLDIDFFQLGGTYMFVGDKARPYIVATIGAAHYRTKGDTDESDTYFAFTIGGGWKLWSTERFGLRLEGRYLGTLVDSNTSLFCTSTPSGSGCLIQTRGKILSQFEATLGGVFRF